MENYTEKCKIEDIMKSLNYTYAKRYGEICHPLLPLLGEDNTAAVLKVCANYEKITGDKLLITSLNNFVGGLLQYVGKETVARIFKASNKALIDNKSAKQFTEILCMSKEIARTLNDQGNANLTSRVYDILEDFGKQAEYTGLPAMVNLAGVSTDVIKYGGIDGLECLKEIALYVAPGGLRATKELIKHGPKAIEGITQRNKAGLVRHVLRVCMEINNGYLAAALFINSPMILADVNDKFDKLLIDKIKSMKIEDAMKFIEKNEEYQRFIKKMKKY